MEETSLQSQVRMKARSWSSLELGYYLRIEIKDFAHKKLKSSSNPDKLNCFRQAQHGNNLNSVHTDQARTSSGWFGRPHFLHGSSSSARMASSLSFSSSSSEAADDFSLSDPSLSSLLEYFHLPRVREPVHRTLPLGFTLYKIKD